MLIDNNIDPEDVSRDSLLFSIARMLDKRDTTITVLKQAAEALRKSRSVCVNESAYDTAKQCEEAYVAITDTLQRYGFL